MSFRLVPKSVTLNDLERRNGIILRYFSEFGYLPDALRKSARSLSHLHYCLLLMTLVLHLCSACNRRTINFHMMMMMTMSSCTNKAIVRQQTSPPIRNLLPLHTTTKSNSVAPSGECVGNSDYLLRHCADVDTANATRHYGAL